jgi:predicted MFS family arabinose efflux permease
MNKMQSRFTLVIIALVMVVLNFDTNVMAATLGTIEAEFKINDSSIGIMMLLFTIIGAAVSLFWGYFSDKASRKMLFFLAVVIGELPCALTALAPSYQIFFALRILSGIGLGAAFPLVFSIIGDVFDYESRPMATGVISVAIAVGNIGGYLLGGWIGAGGDWRLPFVVAAAPNFLFIVLFLIFSPESKKAATEEATKELIEAGLIYPKTIKMSDYAGLFKVKTNLYLFFQGIAGTIPWGSFFYITKYLEEKGLSIKDATNVFSFFGIGMVVGTIVGGQLGASIFKRSPRRLPIFCAVTTLGGALAVIYVVLFAPLNLPLLAASGFVAAFLAAMTGPNMKTMLLDVNAPEQRGAIFSIFNLTDSVGTGIGRGVAGLLSGLIGSLAIPIAICSTLWGLCAVFLFIVSLYFLSDVASLRDAMKRVAEEMKKTVKA